MAVGEEAVVADAMEAIRQGVQEEAADELIGLKRHELGLAMMAVLLPAEGNLAVLHRYRPAVGDRVAVGVATEIGEHLLGPAEGPLGVDHPIDPPKLVQAISKGSWSAELGESADEVKPAGFERGLQVLQEQPAK